jgi:hypothetical protein
VKVNRDELQTVGYFHWISSKTRARYVTAHCRPARPRSTLSLPARLFASGRTAEPEAPLRFTFVTRTRAERNHAALPRPPFEPPEPHFTSVRTQRSFCLTSTASAEFFTLSFAFVPSTPYPFLSWSNHFPPPRIHDAAAPAARVPTTHDQNQVATVAPPKPKWFRCAQMSP